jgi:hypothetical protein
MRVTRAARGARLPQRRARHAPRGGRPHRRRAAGRRPDPAAGARTSRSRRPAALYLSLVISRTKCTRGRGNDVGACAEGSTMMWPGVHKRVFHKMNRAGLAQGVEGGPPGPLAAPVRPLGLFVHSAGRFLCASQFPLHLQFLRAIPWKRPPVGSFPLADVESPPRRNQVTQNGRLAHDGSAAPRGMWGLRSCPWARVYARAQNNTREYTREYARAQKRICSGPSLYSSISLPSIRPPPARARRLGTSSSVRKCIFDGEPLRRIFRRGSEIICPSGPNRERKPPVLTQNLGQL